MLLLLISIPFSFFSLSLLFDGHNFLLAFLFIALFLLTYLLFSHNALLAPILANILNHDLLMNFNL